MHSRNFSMRKQGIGETREKRQNKIVENAEILRLFIQT